MPGKRLTSLDVAERLASKTGLTIEQVKAVLTAQAELAYAEAANGFPVPGIGVLTKTEIPERKMSIAFGVRKGEQITARAKRKLTFRVFHVAQTIAFDHSQPTPDLFKPSPMLDFRFCSQAETITDLSVFLADLGYPFTLARDGSHVGLAVYLLSNLQLPTGRIIARDGIIGGGKPFHRSVPSGSYPLALAAAQQGVDEWIALAVIRFSDNRIVKWEMAVPEGFDLTNLKKDPIFGYGVDSGTGSFCDASVQPILDEVNDADVGFNERMLEEMKSVYKATRNWVHIETPNGSLAVFSSGYGDGHYASYFGLDEAGQPAVLVTDFKLVHWGPVQATP